MHGYRCQHERTGVMRGRMRSGDPRAKAPRSYLAWLHTNHGYARQAHIWPQEKETPIWLRQEAAL